MVVKFVAVISHTMGVTGRAGAAYPSVVPGFTPFIVWLAFFCAPLIVFRICFPIVLFVLQYTVSDSSNVYFSVFIDNK